VQRDRAVLEFFEAWVQSQPIELVDKSLSLT